MMKLRAAEILSLDGVMEGADQWVFQYMAPEIVEHIMDDLHKTRAFLFGRKTYHEMTDWSTRTGEMADIFNTLPKYVVSSTLTDVSGWNNSHIISEHIVEEVARLKEQDDGFLLINGSADLVRLLAEHDLIDEYNFNVVPQVVGKGKRLFQEGDQARLRLVGSQVYTTGLVRLTYEPARG